mmetsp:Transcript_52794/g.59012  ORF Transcript_52794/g.59012 Transcript_52794/m.59012 type:complete len:135 (+) Transcript_52794:130-534(+)|eukprot:CAMPEP_0170797588 /NCGR_PEP_ID=MMETSP0733-20121128/25706_1 /TAXON_ID=186038 /ORGANISM="Fragilariopsis kerguelensis, Strain L26-C5" /LENGTH=134 /DNA_ID=CAMNT_0011148491 /DNA_START=60 /DNA_END=464 /DNA_ORIENTATION=-
MTYTTLANGDQNNSPWVPRALTAVGLGALAFASGTIYRNSNSNNDVVVATTTLVRGGSGENMVFTLADDDKCFSDTCMEKCRDEIKACRKDTNCCENCSDELCDTCSRSDFVEVGPFGGECKALKKCLKDSSCD